MGDDDTASAVNERIEAALRPWRADRVKSMFDAHVAHWAANPPARADAPRNLARLEAQIGEMFADETPVPPDVLLSPDGARRLVLCLGFAPGKPDADPGTWLSMQPAFKFKSQIGQLANMIQTRWEALEMERATLPAGWVGLGACDWGAAFCVPCIPNPFWDNAQTRERVPPLILRYAAFYLWMTLRVLRPYCVVVCNYDAAKMLTFVHEYAHLRTSEGWLGAANLDRGKMVCPETFGAAYVRFGEMAFHVLRFHVPFYMDKLAEKDPGVLSLFDDGVVRFMNVLNPAPRDATRALQQPKPKGNRREKTPRAISVRGQRPVSFKKN